jgi:hypothetical protein
MKSLDIVESYKTLVVHTKSLNEPKHKHDHLVLNKKNGMNFLLILFSVRSAYRILVRIPEGKRPLGRPRRRWANNIKMDRMGWYGLDRSGSG